LSSMRLFVLRCVIPKRVYRTVHVLEYIPKPSELCRVSGPRGGQSPQLAALGPRANDQRTSSAYQARWHGSAKLEVPDRITIVLFPARSPELNPVKNVWQLMRDNWLSNRVSTSLRGLEQSH
jgi:hypothetical protein